PAHPLSQDRTKRSGMRLSAPRRAGMEREISPPENFRRRHEESAPMAHKSANFLTALLTSTAFVLSPVAAQAGGMGHFGMSVPNVPKLQCPEGVPSGHPMPGMNRSFTFNKTNNFNNTLDVYKPVTV